MQLTRWDPIHEIDDLSTRVNRLLGLTRFNGELADWVPACNVMENDKEYRLRVELPDMKKEDIHVKMDDRVLVIEGERKEEKEDKGMRFHRRELTYGKFVRRFTMPEEIEASKIQTSFRDGMLELVLPKMKVTLPKVKEIPVS